MILRPTALLVLAAILAAACGTTGGGPSGCQQTQQIMRAAARSAPSAPPRALAPDLVSVRLRAGVPSARVRDLGSSAGLTLKRSIPQIGWHSFRLPPGTPWEGAAVRLRALPEILQVEQVGRVVAFATPNDFFYPQQWHYPQISLPGAWDLITGAPGVRVAVVDTGIRRDHQDLLGVTVAGYDFVDDDFNPVDPGDPTFNDSHGTHVSGTVRVLSNNGVGVAGVNWTSTMIMPVRVLGADGSGTFDDVAAGITFAADNGAQIINLSLGSTIDDPMLRAAVTYAAGLNVVLVGAAGNANNTVPSYPAAYPDVISVVATNRQNQKASYSSFGSTVDIAAPGGEQQAFNDPDGVLSTNYMPNSNTCAYRFLQGTSMAAPHVSGVVALMIGRGIIGPAAIKNKLYSTATDLGTPGPDNTFGNGLVNAAAAVAP